MSENTTEQTEQDSKSEKHNRTMLMVVLGMAVAFVALIALNMK